ncbi:MAG: PQQ-binding-like beta-propeller repeat protein [Acidobacteriota bacterium]|nr:PQQ-binding-like beta-propeller repeat protein [Acidobacteriota bacterium]
MSTVDRWLVVGLGGFVVVAVAAAGADAQQGTEQGEWPHYAGDHTSSKYSPLDQIDRDNFSELRVAWSWESADMKLEDVTRMRPGPYRSTPLMVNSVLYVPTGLAQVAALDPGTGETIWIFDPKDYERDDVRKVGLVQVRGLEYWTDGTRERIVLATRARRLISIDAKTGKLDLEFGVQGVVDLDESLPPGRINRNISHSAPVIVVADTIVVGSAINDFPLRNNSPPGHIRGYDVLSGRLNWIFYSIPQQGQAHNETWENDSWKTVGNTNVWSMMSADHELGYVYLPFGTPTNDYYGGHRLGDNVYAESLVCLNASNGEVVWHFQAVHHGVWDYDLATAPNLIDITVDGKQIKAVAVASKQSMIYVFDRATGEPVWPIVEAPVNYHSSIPGERLSKTQPFPTRPPPIETLGLDYDDLIDFTPELRAEALELVRDYVIGPIFTPPVIHGEDGKLAYIQVPGPGGGANWTGASFDPETQMLYVPSISRPGAISLSPPDPARSDWRYSINRRPTPKVRGLPITKPPYWRITAIDMNRGEHAWVAPLGEGPRDHPAIRHLNLPRLGTPPRDGIVTEGGVLVTKTLLITLEPIVDELGDRSSHGSYIDAFDKATGELLAQVEVGINLHSSPMTYMHDGRQYLLIAGGGERPGPGTPISQTASTGSKAPPAPREPPRRSEMLAFALPR